MLSPSRPGFADRHPGEDEADGAVKAARRFRRRRRRGLRPDPDHGNPRRPAPKAGGPAAGAPFQYYTRDAASLVTTSAQQDIGQALIGSLPRRRRRR